MLSLLRHRRVAEPLAPASIDIDGMAVPVTFKRNSSAKRLILRIERRRHGVAVTVPSRASRAEALAFVLASHAWVARELAKRPQALALAPGMAVPLRGLAHDIRLAPQRRGSVRVEPEGPAIVVPGDAVHAPRRLGDWLKGEARHDLGDASQRHAAAMGVRFRRLAVRDQASRWGSCSAKGALSYSWRLILAPPFVLDYVAAHEVAHLRHLNHGKAFWRLVLSSCPDAARARDWLKRNGAELHRYGN